MSGLAQVKKLAICIGPDAASRVAAMLERQRYGGLAVSRRDVSEGAIGYVGGALAASGNLCCFTGTPINGPQDEAFPDAAAAARAFPEYDGAFAGIFWDDLQRTLIIATDCLGMQPLYMRHDSTGLTLVSDTKAAPGNPDPAAWGAFISIGHPIAERSLVDGLVRVPPASVLTYDVATRRLATRRYWHWPRPSDAWRDYDFTASLTRDVRGYASHGLGGTLLLSGGFDSRLLLFLLRHADVPVNALIVAHDDEHRNLDGRLAESIAGVAEVSYRTARPPVEFFSSREYLDYLEACDAGYPTLDLFIAKVASQIHADAVWDGLAPGFVFMPLHQSAGGFKEYLQREIRGPDSAIWRAAEGVFRSDVVAAMRRGFERDLAQELERLPQDEFGLTRFVIENRSRNRPAMNPLKVYMRRSSAYVPGVSKDFMTHAAVIPYREKAGGSFYRSLFERLDRRALAAPFLSGGELLPNTDLSGAYWRERLRIAYLATGSRHPHLFGLQATRKTARSSFLGCHLFDDDDPWIAPRARDLMKEVTPANYVAWKLLFHWKAWRWVHEGKLRDALEPFASGQPAPG